MIARGFYSLRSSKASVPAMPTDNTRGDVTIDNGGNSNTTHVGNNNNNMHMSGFGGNGSNNNVVNSGDSSGNNLNIALNYIPQEVIDHLVKLVPPFLAEVRKSSQSGSTVPDGGTVDGTRMNQSRSAVGEAISADLTADRTRRSSVGRSGDSVDIIDIMSLDPSALAVNGIADRYARSLLKCLYGYPVYKPQPLSEFSEQYLRNGVNVGDVGFVTWHGDFDFLFNICPARNRSINPPQLPDDFGIHEDMPMRAMETLPRMAFFQDPVTKTKSGEYICNGHEGAILELPEGAIEESALNMRPFEELATRRGVEWYEYATVKRRKAIKNGSLYLITSSTKCSQWGIAVFDRSCDSGQGLKFNTKKKIPFLRKSSSKYHWKGLDARTTKVANPRKEDGLNQCVFLRGYKIMIRQDIFNNLVNNRRCESKPAVPSSSLQDGNNRRPAWRGRGGAGPDPISRRLASGSLSTLSTMSTVTKSDEVVIHSNFNSSPIHPSDIINAALLSQNPDAKIALTYDDVWCDLLRDNFPQLNYSSLISIARSYTSTVNEHGCVSLEKISDSSNENNENNRPIREAETPALHESVQNDRDICNPGISTQPPTSGSRPDISIAPPAIDYSHREATGDGNHDISFSMQPPLITSARPSIDRGSGDMQSGEEVTFPITTEPLPIATELDSLGFRDRDMRSGEAPPIALVQELSNLQIGNMNINTMDGNTSNRRFTDAQKNLVSDYVASAPVSLDIKLKDRMSTKEVQESFQSNVDVLDLSDQIECTSELIGMGGFSRVYKGRWVGEAVNTNRPPIVVKVISISLPQDERKRQSKQIKRELELWSKINHKNILSLLGIAYIDHSINVPAFICPLMENGNAKQFRSRNPSFPHVLLLYDIIQGLHYLHTFEPEIVHGDIKATNVLINDRCEACLYDFGLSRFLCEDTLWITMAEQAGGTLRWMSPELISGEASTPTKESDIYAYAMTCYEILSGHVPFKPVVSESAVLYKILRGERPKRVESCHTDYMWNIITRCWAENPEDRPCAAEVLELVQSARTGLEKREATSSEGGETQFTDAQKNLVSDYISNPAVLLDIKPKDRISTKEVQESFRSNVDVLDLSGQIECTSELIGRGRFSRVYKGRWVGEAVNTNRPPIVVKVVSISLPQDERQRQSKQIKRIAYIDHDINIPAFICPLMENGNAKQFRSRNPSFPHVLLLYDIIQGLHYLHTFEPEIVHGDIKAVNVLINDRCEACLYDFGLSRFLSEDTLWITTALQAGGTLRWMSPELMSGEAHTPTKESDIYAYAMTCYEILSGDIPFKSVTNEAVIIYKIMKGQRPGRIEPYHTDSMWDIITRCWVKNPEDRPCTAEVLELIQSSRTGLEKREATGSRGGETGTG